MKKLLFLLFLPTFLMAQSIDYTVNFARATVSTGYDASATTVILSSGTGSEFPDPATYGAFNLTWWNSSDYGDPSNDPNKEIVRVTARSTDTLTITRAQESTSATSKNTSGKTYEVILGFTARNANTRRDSLRALYPAMDSTWASIGTNAITDASGDAVSFNTPDTLRAWWIKQPDVSKSDSTRSELYGGNLYFHQPFNSPIANGVRWQRAENANSEFVFALDVAETINPYFALWQAAGYSSPAVTGDVFTVGQRNSLGQNVFSWGTSVGSDTSTSSKFNFYNDKDYAMYIAGKSDFTKDFTGFGIEFRNVNDNTYGFQTVNLAPPGNRGWHWLITDSISSKWSWWTDFTKASKWTLDLYEHKNSTTRMRWDSAGTYAYGTFYTSGKTGIVNSPHATYNLYVGGTSSILTDGKIFVGGTAYFQTNNITLGGSPWGGGTTTIAALAPISIRVSAATGNAERIVVGEDSTIFKTDVEIDSVLTVDGESALNDDVVIDSSLTVTNVGIGGSPSASYPLYVVGNTLTTGLVYAGSYYRHNTISLGGSPWGGSATTIAALAPLSFRVASGGNTDKLVIDTTVGVTGYATGDFFYNGAGSGMPYGSIIAEGVTDTTTLTTQNVWYKCSPFDSAGATNLTTVSVAGLADSISVTKAGVYMVNVSVSFAGTVNSTYEMSVVKNNSVWLSGLHLERKIGAAADIGVASISGTATLAADDELTIYVRCTDGSSKVFATKDINFTVFMIGG